MIANKDARAVENPISAMFDLAEDVYDQTPRLKKMIWYAIAFISIWWLVNLIVTIVLFVVPPFIFGFFTLALLIIGLLALRLLFKTKDFLIYYEIRHKAIQTVRTANPEVKIPDGKTPSERILNYLKDKSPDVRFALRNDLVRMGQNATLKIVSGSVHYELDAYIIRPSSIGWRILDIGDRGFAFYMKYFDHPPTLEEIKKFESAVISNTSKIGTPPSRVILLLSSASEDKLSDDVYDYIVKNVIKTSYFMSTYYCTMQIIIESSDNTYDFIPFVVDS